MIKGARQLPAHHLTIRVPWHDNGWRGTVCNNPCGNTSCIILPSIAKTRDDDLETHLAGTSLEDLEQEQHPPCVNEHATIMSPFSLSLRKNHPYVEFGEVTHGHFKDTPYTIQPYSAAVVPFRWMLREEIEGNPRRSIRSKADIFELGYDAKREPDLTLNKGWKHDPKTWVQEGTNQRVILDTFFSAAVPDESLVFFYAKRTPLAEDARRVIVGVGRVKSVADPVEYRYIHGKPPKDKISGYLWERNIEHSIRPDGRDGFLLPYEELLAIADQNEDLDIVSCTAFAPDEYFQQYSYGSELLPQDGAIASLLSLEKAIKEMRSIFDAPWEDYLQWIDKELNRLWQVRGAFPGLGAALHAFGIPHANLLAWHLMDEEEEMKDPWPLFTSVLEDPSSLPEHLREGIGSTLRQKWKKLPDTRRDLLKLLARFNLSNDQALCWYQETERQDMNIEISDKDILANPYRIYEEDRLQVDPIAFAMIDRGMFPPEVLREAFPVPEPSRVHEAVDPRRVRAVMVQTLEEAAAEGHTILPVDWLIRRVRERPMKPDCPLDIDTLPIIEDSLYPLIHTVSKGEQNEAFQLKRYEETSRLIRTKISKRVGGTRNSEEFDWVTLVNQAIDGDKQSPRLSADDEQARKEKAAALKELYQSKISVLVGSAGTGKSTLIKALCKIEPVKGGGVLLLAPTGKARVRLEQASDMPGQGQTIAQFLNRFKRYNGDIGLYYINEGAQRSSANKTVVIDECSMLTEEQLAALLDAVKGVQRLILVGDPRQLPPIGAGRPYVDIVEYLKPEEIESEPIRVAPGYAELTVTMRQLRQDHAGADRIDVLLANAFSGYPQDPGADEIWNMVMTEETPFIKLVRWNQPDQLQDLLIKELVAELELESQNDQRGFEASIGGAISEHNDETHVFFNTKYKDRQGAAEKSEMWQILTPVRQGLTGVLALNRAIQRTFRQDFIDRASTSNRRKTIPSPAGSEGIIYGDKVINVINSSRRRIHPDKDDSYVANGDIGIVTGHRRTRYRNFQPRDIEVEFATQLGFSYTYRPGEFDGQESTPPLELAYALTVHKTQGSEFKTTFLVVPNPCRILSRELLYTALTRHRGKIIIFHQKDFHELQQYAHAGASEVARRMTNLFTSSSPTEVQIWNQLVFLDSNRIYRTERGELVRSKSEWIIADKLHAKNIDYQYEQPLMLDGIERWPDFTIVDDDSGATWYWEHNGLLDNDSYRRRWERKLAAYRAEGILPLDEGGGANGTLLITEEKRGIGLDLTEIEKNIEAILE